MPQDEVQLILKAVDQATATFRKVGSGLDDLGDKTSKFNQTAKEVAKVMAAAGAAVGAFAISSVERFSSVGDAIEKMSRRTGFSAESISVLRFAADQTGTSLENMEGGLKAMAKSLDQMGKDSDSAKAMLQGFNLSIADLQAMTPEQRFLALGQAINNIQDPTERSARAMDIFGRTGSELIPFFEEAGGNMDAFREKASRLGLVMDTETAAKAAKLNDTLGELKGQVLGVQLQLGEALFPVVQKMNEVWLPAAISGWQNFGANLRGVWQDLKDAVTNIFDAIHNKITSVLDGVMAKVNSALDAWNRMVATISQPLNTVGTAFKNLPANLGFKAEGGPVDSGMPYIVGERGPELFVPRGGGNIIPAGQFGGGGGIVVNISGNTISSQLDMERLAQKVGEEIMRVVKFNNKI